MQKRYIVLITMVLFFIGGCRINNSDYSTPISHDAPAMNYENIYMLEEASFEEKNDSLDVKIRYLQIKNNKNSLVEKINEIIKKAAINKYYEYWDLNGFTLDQTYKLKMHSSELLSIAFYQYAYVSGTAHPNDNCHAITINLKTAEKLALSDFVKSYEDIKNSILAGKYEILYGGLQSFNSDEIVKYISDDFKNIPIEENTDYFYVSEDGFIYIIIDLPHAAGDYSVIKINL